MSTQPIRGMAASMPAVQTPFYLIVAQNFQKYKYRAKLAHVQNEEFKNKTPANKSQRFHLLTCRFGRLVTAALPWLRQVAGVPRPFQTGKQ
ncbi:hypothetical protein [Acutalibacter caecimuris]|uniref:hypothetical protein n=1 Tax=Acutalibacter caecimuris TaxID=3093657 RepID=UPI002AC97569|nr:hypothetical protein [Acutalibacter sp. M00118]